MSGPHPLLAAQTKWANGGDRSDGTCEAGARPLTSVTNLIDTHFPSRAYAAPTRIQLDPGNLSRS